MLKKDFIQVIKASQGRLFALLAKKYKSDAIINKGSYICVKGDLPIMLVAHLDTVHDKPVRNICISQDNNILMSPQGIGGDDRCGVYALTQIYSNANKKPFLLFCCDEEIGGYGAHDFVDDYEKGIFKDIFSGLKCLVELDRRGKNDAVYYNCDNQSFEDYITSKGFITAHGSFSDISVVAPALGVAAVNLSSGYYNAHSIAEYINISELNTVIKKVSEIISEARFDDFPIYKYIPVTKKHWSFYNGKKRAKFSEFLDYSKFSNSEFDADSYIDNFGNDYSEWDYL